MSTITAVLIHLEPEQVHERLDLLRAVSEPERFVVCYGGERSQFQAIEAPDKVFVDDPTLRGPEQHLQSWTSIFEAVWHGCFSSDPAAQALYLIEYDHLILDPRFAARLGELAASTGADFLGKNCVDRTGTNSEHYVRFRSDPRLLAHLRRVSVREDRTRVFGCLGNGMWLSRRALEAYVEVGTHPPCYCETYVPTLLHHLGLRVVDVDAHSDMYRHVRWIPPFGAAEVAELQRRGVPFVHPVKDRAAVQAARHGLEPAPLATPTSALSPT